MGSKIIFEEMGFFARMSSDRRKKYIMDKAQTYAELSNRFGKRYNSEKYSTDVEISFNKYTLLSFLYGEYASNGFHKQFQNNVINAYFKWMHHSDDLRSAAYQRMFEELKSNRVVAELLPKIFSDEFPKEWELQKVVKAQAAKEKQEKRAGLEKIISSLESERSRLYSMFSSMSGFSRTQISVSIDALDSRIGQFKSELASLS